MRRVTRTWGWCLLITSGCGARSPIQLEESPLNGGAGDMAASNAGSSMPGGSANLHLGGTGNGGASPGGGGIPAAGPLQGTAGATGASLPPIATAISSGTDMACALMSDGSVRCWGSNDRGQLGDGTLTSSMLAVRVLGISNAIAIVAGGTWNSGGQGAANSAYGCAVLTDGSVKCWGRFPGRPYDYSDADSPDTTTIAGVSDAIAIAGGDWHACVLQASGSVQCWGDASEGELGNGVVTNCRPWSCPPDTVGTKPVTAHVTGVIGISGQGSLGSCAVLATGVVECWGSFMADVNKNPFPFLVAGVVTTANGLSAGYDHACAVTPSGGVQCWRGNAQPVAVAGLTGPVLAVSAGLTHTCVLLEDGTVECWLEESAGSNGASAPRPNPNPITDISNAIAVSVGYTGTCALIRDGSVRCWGSSSIHGTKPQTIGGL